MSWATTSTHWVLVFLSYVFLFIWLTSTYLITCTSALQTLPNHSGRFHFKYDIIFEIRYSSCSSWFFLLSYLCNSVLYLRPYIIFLSTFLSLLSPLVSDQVSFAYVTIGHKYLLYNSAFELRDSSFDLISFIIL